MGEGKGKERKGVRGRGRGKARRGMGGGGDSPWVLSKTMKSCFEEATFVIKTYSSSVTFSQLFLNDSP